MSNWIKNGLAMGTLLFISYLGFSQKFVDCDYLKAKADSSMNSIDAEQFAPDSEKLTLTAYADSSFSCIDSTASFQNSRVVLLGEVHKYYNKEISTILNANIRSGDIILMEGGLEGEDLSYLLDSADENSRFFGLSELDISFSVRGMEDTNAYVTALVISDQMESYFEKFTTGLFEYCTRLNRYVEDKENLNLSTDRIYISLTERNAYLVSTFTEQDSLLSALEWFSLSTSNNMNYFAMGPIYSDDQIFDIKFKKKTLFTGDEESQLEWLDGAIGLETQILENQSVIVETLESMLPIYESMVTTEGDIIDMLANELDSTYHPQRETAFLNNISDALDKTNGTIYVITGAYHVKNENITSSLREKNVPFYALVPSYSSLKRKE